MNKKIFHLTAALIICAAIIVLMKESPWMLRGSLGIIAGGIYLWISEPIPMPLTALIMISAFAATGAVPLETALSGFATKSLFLILAGFMMAEGVNSTPLVKRLTYHLLIKFGATPGGSLLAMLLILQLMAFFIPSIAVKVTLLLPVVLSIAGTLPPGRSNTKTILLLGLAFGVSVTSLGLLPAAIANVIAADVINKFTGYQITYVEWMLYNLPLSLILIPVTWKVLLWAFPPEVEQLPGGLAQIRTSLEGLGPISMPEKRCILILALTIGLWMTEKLHGMHSAVPALIAVVLMALPSIGIVDWEKLIRINWGTIILCATNISLGTVLMVTGGSAFLSAFFFPPALADYIFTTPLAAVVFLAFFVQLYHLAIGNVATLVVSVLPVVLELALPRAAGAALPLGFATAASALCGFVLVIQTIPNVIVYGTGLLARRDLIKAGLVLTLAAIAGIVLIAATWWRLLGLY